MAIRTSLSALLLLLSIGLAAQAQGGHTLQGRVIAPNGMQPLGPVKVTLTFNGRRIYEGFSDLGGRFSFTGLARGTYQLTAEGDGQTFETTTVYAEVAAFGPAPQMFSQDIQLLPIKHQALPRAGVVNAFTQVVPTAARQAFDRAMKLINESKTDGVIEELQGAINLFPSYFEAHLQLGTQLMRLGRLTEAVSELDRAREINPNDERLYQSFGLILMQQKNYPVAVAIFAEAARLNPVNPFNVLMKATALIHQAYALNPSTAAPDREHLLSRIDLALTEVANLSGRKLKPDHLTLAKLYEMKGERNRAASELEEFLKANPNAREATDVRKAIDSLRSSTPTPVNH